jgi:hypothetical protein
VKRGSNKPFTTDRPAVRIEFAVAAETETQRTETAAPVSRQQRMVNWSSIRSCRKMRLFGAEVAGGKSARVKFST